MATREVKDLLSHATTSDYGVAKLATGGGTTAGTVVQGNDSRLTAAADLAAHIADTSAAHAATAIAFTPAGTIAATTVQAAIEEVASEAGASGPLDNFAATSDPAVTDDSGDGYDVGSRWINTASDTEFVATDISVGAAVWKRTTPGSGVTDAADVTYDPSTSGLAATDVQAAIDEVAAVGGGGGALVRLYDSTLGAPAANFDVASGLGGYRDLILALDGYTDVSGGEACRLRLNNDSAGHYDYEQRTCFLTTLSAGSAAAQTSHYVGDLTDEASAGALPSGIEIAIRNYDQGTYPKPIHAMGNTTNGIGSGTPYILREALGWWRGTAAVARVTLFPASGNFGAGTRLTIWGRA